MNQDVGDTGGDERVLIQDSRLQSRSCKCNLKNESLSDEGVVVVVVVAWWAGCPPQ